MRKKLLAVLMTGAMVASFAGSATAVFAKSDDVKVLIPRPYS